MKESKNNQKAVSKERVQSKEQFVKKLGKKASIGPVIKPSVFIGSHLKCFSGTDSNFS